MSNPAAKRDAVMHVWLESDRRFGFRFTSPIPTYKLVGDITYLRTGEEWLCLATVIDPCTRMVVAGRSPTG